MIDSNGPKPMHPLIQLAAMVLGAWIVVAGTVDVADTILPTALFRDIDGSVRAVFQIALCVEGAFGAALGAFLTGTRIK